MSTHAKHPTHRGLTLEEKRHRIRQNAPAQQSCGTTMQTSGVGTFDQPDCFLFGYVFTEQPKMHYGAEVVGFDPTSDTAPVSQGYVSEWFINADGHYEGAFVGARVLDGPKNATVTHHFHFNATAMKGITSAPSVVNTTPPTVINPADGSGSLGGVNAGTVGDGQPPASSPLPTVVGGVGSLFTTWTAITNSSPVTYDVHLSTSNAAAPSAADLVGNCSSPMLNITKDASGNSLTAYSSAASGTAQTYYVALVARDIDGTAPPSAWVGPIAPRLASTNDIDANWIYANNILANQISGGVIVAGVTISGSIATATNGARVTMDANGLHVYGSDGTLEVDLNVNGTNYFSGNADIGNLTVEGTTQLRGAATVMAAMDLTAGNKFTIDGSTAVAVGSATPTLSVDWLTVGIGSGVTGSSLQWDGTNSRWIVATRNSGGGTLLAVDPASGAVSSVGGTSHPASVSAVYGGGFSTYGYVVGRDASGNVNIYDITHGYYNAVASDSHVFACVDQSGTFIYTLEQNAALAGPLVHRYDPTLITGSGQNYGGSVLVTGLNSWPSNYQIVGFAVAAGDLGATRYLVTARNTSTGSTQVFSYDSSGNRVTAEDFYANGALAYDGSNFWSLVNSNLVKHEGGSHKLSGLSSTWYGAYTWKNTGAPYETTMGTVSSVTMLSRARITIGGTTLPGGASVDHVGLYLGTGSAVANMHIQATTTGAGQLLGTPSYGTSPTLANMSAANPPTTNNFPAAASANLVSGATDGTGALIQFNGDGSWRLGGGAVAGATPASGQSLQFNGTSWLPYALADTSASFRIGRWLVQVVSVSVSLPANTQSGTGSVSWPTNFSSGTPFVVVSANINGNISAQYSGASTTGVSSVRVMWTDGSAGTSHSAQSVPVTVVGIGLA